MAYNKLKGYDPDRDYSLEMQQNGYDPVLNHERENKIMDMYGGVDPYKKPKELAPGSATTGNDAFGWNKHAGFIQPAAPTYSGSWQDKLNKAANDYLAGSYDKWLQSDQYKALSQRYGKAGQQAMQDTLGKVSAQTGGMASSYATAAAAGAYEDYMAKLEDAARNMYAGERQDAASNVSLLQNLDNTERSRFEADRAQFNTDRNYNYNQWRDEIGDERYASETEYNRGRDAINDQRYAEELDWNRNSDMAKTLAASGDFSGYKALGYSDAQIATMKAAYQAAMALKARSGGSGGSGGSKGKTGDEGNTGRKFEDIYAGGEYEEDGRTYEEGSGAEIVHRMIKNGMTTDDVADQIDYWVRNFQLDEATAEDLVKRIKKGELR